MKYRRLGKTGLLVSVVGIGTWQYCGDWGKAFTREAVGEILHKAKENGLNLIDTAECYGDHVSETLIGASLPGKREEWIISTKYGHAFNEKTGEKYADFSARGVRRQLEGSLRALHTDYVDILLFHSGTMEQLENDELWTELDRLRAKGMIRHAGVSLHPDIRENVRQTGAAAARGAQVMEVLYNRLERIAEDAVFPMCRENDIGVVGRVPLCSGYLSGKYNPESVFTKDDVRENYHKKEERMEKLGRAEMIGRYEVPEGMPMSQWAMAWCLKNKAVSAIVGGFKDARQLEDAVRAADIDLT